MKFLKSYVCVLLLFVAGVSKATNYYVDPSSTASTQSGTQAAPWKTLAQVQSNMNSFQAGDFIYFKKGETFTGALNITKSGTAAAPITFSTYGTASTPPVFTGTASDLFSLDNRQYIVIDGFKITDPNLDPNDRTQEAIIDIAFSIDGSSYITIKNCDISLVGVAVYMNGSNNTMDRNTIGNLRMIRNTVGGDDDYGANPVVITGSNNNITGNYFKDCWAYSYDYTYDGGAIEMYGAANNNNKIMYNTAVNCDGFMEIGFSGGGATNDNIVAYNKIINCGELVYISNSGQYATAVNNMQFYNNVIVHTVNQLTLPSSMIGMSASSSTANIINLKNNIFWLTTGIDVARSGKFSGTQLTHEDNIYHLGTGSVLNFTSNASELTTAATIFTSISGTDPMVWNYAPAAGSPAIDFGQNLGIAKDFAGNTVPAVPNAGILESAGGGTGGTPLAAASTGTSISCFGGTTVVTVSATGGTAPYTGAGNFTVSAGTYTYTVTDAAGATATTSITVTQASAITANVAAGTIAAYGGTTTVTVSVSGGTGAYTYSLDNGTYQTSASFTAVAAGNHSVTVKDAKGCTGVKAFTITQPAASNPITVSSTSGSIACNGGTATVTVSATGGTTPYTGTGTFTKAAGTYTFTVTDAAGATGTTSITVTQPTALAVMVSSGTIATNGGTTTITVNASGGTPAYTYKLNSGAYQTSNSFTAVPAGDHTVTVKDKNGCTIAKAIKITQPGSNPLIATSVAGTISCNRGTTTITVSATGGTAPYTGTGTFTVSSGTYSYTVTDATGTTSITSVTVAQPTAITITVAAGTVTSASGTTTVTVTAAGGTPGYTYKLDAGTYQSSNVFTGVGVGTHSITVRDSRACSAEKSFTVSVTGTSPLVIHAVAGTISCYGGNTTVTMSATGGVAPYTGTGTFNVTAGTYTYTVTDAAGTTGTTSVTVTQPTIIAATLVAGTITTAGGTTSITVTATGGSGVYTYKLNSGSYQTSNSFSGVPVGTHTITVKDGKGCSISKSITITQTTGTATFKLILVSKTNESCKGKKDGKITVTGSGGVAPYTYRINYGAYTSNGTFTNLKPGFYVITGRSANGATSTVYVWITAATRSCTGARSEQEKGTTEPSATTTTIDGLKINAYPNPTTTKFSLLIENGSNEDAQIVVMNMNGQKVYEGRSKVFAKTNFGRNFVSGIYIVKVTQGKNTETLKLVKSK